MLTLRNLWRSGFSVIVSYEHSITSCHSELWPHIPYWWANKCKAEALIEAFEHRKKHDRPGTPLYCTQTVTTTAVNAENASVWRLRNVNLLFVFMLSAEGFFVTGINLTVDLKYICTHPTESLKDLVMSTNPTLMSWVEEQSPGSKLGTVNIVAGDFITESHFVPTVVALNQKLLKRSL